MPHLETYEAILDYNQHGIYIWTNHYSLLHELIEHVENVWVSDCSVRYKSGSAVELKQLNSLDIQIGDALYWRLLNSGWEIVNRAPHGRTEDKWGAKCTFRRAERFTSVVDDLERLMELLEQRRISDAEYEALKRKLID